MQFLTEINGIVGLLFLMKFIFEGIFHVAINKWVFLDKNNPTTQTHIKLKILQKLLKKVLKYHNVIFSKKVPNYCGIENPLTSCEAHNRISLKSLQKNGKFPVEKLQLYPDAVFCRFNRKICGRLLRFSPVRVAIPGGQSWLSFFNLSFLYSF